MSEIYPALKEEAAQLRGEDLTGLSVAELWERIFAYVERATGELVMYHQLSIYLPSELINCSDWVSSKPMVIELTRWKCN